MELYVPLPPLLAEGLTVVFIGTEPGKQSIRRQQYYADPSNRFYAHLEKTDFTPHRLAPRDFGDLLRYGIGLDDVYDDPSELRIRLEAAAPQSICFNSGDAFRRYAGLDRLPQPWRRGAAARYVELGDAIVWATSDSSFNASAHWSARVDDLHALRARLRNHSPSADSDS
jgi:TDG/mug DNA glycosylase family protein